MSLTGAIIAGIVATFVSWVTTRLSTRNQMGMELIFGSMFSRGTQFRQRPILGFVLLYMGGAILGVIYAALWSVEIGWPDYLWGFIFGVVQWLVLGLALGALPFFHAGIRSGATPYPGPYMTRLLGPLAFVAGLTNHVIFGFVVAYVYQFFRSRYG
jgi:hypothetical protein